MSAALLLAALLAAQPAAPQPDWAPLGEDRVASYQYDRSSVRREGDQVYFTIYSRALNPQGAPYAAFMARHRLDCPRGALLIVGLTGYDAAGTAVFTRDTPAGQEPAIPMTPGSPQVRARELLCAAPAPGTPQ
jgi:hypothetical protein